MKRRRAREERWRARMTGERSNVLCKQVIKGDNSNDKIKKIKTLL